MINKRGHFLHLNSLSYIIIINIIFFILSEILLIINPSSVDYLALNPYNLFHNYYFWTLLTSIFMHSGFFHLLANMLSLYFIGNILVKILGEKRFMFLYFSSGIFAGIFFSLISLFFPSQFNTYAVGASGAIFGLIGVLMVLTPNLPVYIMFIPIPVKMKYAAPLMFILLWAISFIGNVPIGNLAHLGGLLFGLVYGLFLKNKFKNKSFFIRNYFK